MAQGHIPFQSPPFWWFMPTQHKATRTSAKSLQIKTNFEFYLILAYMDHLLPPLGLFLQIKLKPLSLSQTHMLKHKESHSKRDWSKISKTPPNSHNQYFSPQEANFWRKRQCKSFEQTKSSILLFSKSLKCQNLSSGSWSIYYFGLYFLPLWHQAPKRDQSWPFNPIASPKSSIRIQRQ